MNHGDNPLEQNANESRSPRSDEELLAFAQEHVLYEMQMFFSTARYIREQVVDAALVNRADDGMAARNALIESFAIHGRGLCDFFYGPDNSPRPNDVLAEDYVDAWEKPARQNSLNRPGLSDRTGFEVAHLSFGRMHVEQEAKGWPIDQIVRDMAPIVRRFASEAPESRVGSEFPAQVEAAIGPLLEPDVKRTMARASAVAGATVLPGGWNGGTATQLPGPIPTQPPPATAEEN